MFILSFIVMFGVKKGSIIAYRPGWSSLLTNQVHIIFSNFKKGNMSALTRLFIYRFHFTAITSRTTSYMLFSF